MLMLMLHAVLTIAALIAASSAPAAPAAPGGAAAPERIDPAAALSAIEGLLARADTAAAARAAAAHATRLLREIVSGEVPDLTPELHDVVAGLLDLGVADMTPDRASRGNGDTLLHSAVRRGDLTLVRMLLLAGANPHARSDDGLMTPLHLAIDYGHYELAHYILKETHRVVADREGRTALHLAVLRAPPEVVEMLLNAQPGAMDIRDHHGDTPLALAQTLPPSQPILDVLGATAASGGGRLHSTPGRQEPKSAPSTVYNTAVGRRRYRSGSDRLRGNGHYRRAGAGAKRKDRLRCDLDVLDWDDFQGDEDALMRVLTERYYARSRPVVVRNGVKHWGGRRMLTKRQIVASFGNLVVSTSAVPYVDEEKKTIREFVTQCLRPGKTPQAHGCVDNEILFDRVYDESFLEAITLPKVAKMCLSAYSRPAGLRWPQLVVSGPQAGAPFHEHQHALNGLLFGSKEWMLVPPGFGHLLAASNITNSARALKQRGGWARAKDFLDEKGVLASCTQLAGDLLYVPRLWPHATRALEESVAIAVEFCSAVGTEFFAHHERTAAELYGGDAVVDGSDYDQSEYVEPVGAGLRDFFSGPITSPRDSS